MSGVKLTGAQRRYLEKSSKPGGAVGFGQKYTVGGALRRMGFITPNTENYGYMVITAADRLALSQGGGE